MNTVLFGSGATIPFFEPALTTGYLTEQVCNASRWDKLVAEYRRRTANQIADSSEIVKLLNDIDKLLQLFPQKKNFEVYAELIDKIASVGFDKIPGNNIMNTLLRILVKQYNRDFGPEWMDVPFLFREIIIQSIIDLEQNGKVNDYDVLCSKQHDFIEWLASHDQKTSLVSLNYDNVLFDSIKGLGFEHCFGIAPQLGNMDSFDYQQFHDSDKVVYFPHGHSRFKRNSFDSIQYFDDPVEAEKSRWRGVGDNTINSSLTLTDSVFSYNFNTFMTTGQTKDSALNLSPYDAYYQRLAKDLWDSDWVYIIGYSFSDEHINRLLHSYIYSKPFSNILIVDYLKDNVNQAEDVVNGTGLVRKIRDVFKPDVIFPNIADIEQYEPQGIREINEWGYGQLFKSIYLYKNGTTAFLDEFRDLPFL